MSTRKLKNKREENTESWKKRYRKYVTAVVKDINGERVVDFHIERPRSTILFLEIRGALEESLKKERIVKGFRDVPFLLEPYIVRVALKEDAEPSEVDRLLEKYASYWNYFFYRYY